MNCFLRFAICSHIWYLPSEPPPYNPIITFMDLAQLADVSVVIEISIFRQWLEYFIWVIQTREEGEQRPVHTFVFHYARCAMAIWKVPNVTPLQILKAVYSIVMHCRLHGLPWAKVCHPLSNLLWIIWGNHFICHAMYKLPNYKNYNMEWVGSLHEMTSFKLIPYTNFFGINQDSYFPHIQSPSPWEPCSTHVMHPLHQWHVVGVLVFSFAQWLQEQLGRRVHLQCAKDGLGTPTSCYY